MQAAAEANPEEIELGDDDDDDDGLEISQMEVAILQPALRTVLWCSCCMCSLSRSLSLCVCCSVICHSHVHHSILTGGLPMQVPAEVFGAGLLKQAAGDEAGAMERLAKKQRT